MNRNIIGQKPTINEITQLTKPRAHNSSLFNIFGHAYRSEERRVGKEV